MAYGNVLAAIPERALASLRTVAAHRVEAAMKVLCSHLIAYWVKSQPLGGLLGRALDGGDLVIADQPHPFRQPVVHRPESVRALHLDLTTAWEQSKQEFDEDEWTREEIVKVVRLFAYASEHAQCVLSYLV